MFSAYSKVSDLGGEICAGGVAVTESAHCSRRGWVYPSRASTNELEHTVLETVVAISCVAGSLVDIFVCRRFQVCLLALCPGAFCDFEP